MSEAYVVVAYRWGWTNNSFYFVWGGTDEDEAIAAAEKECEDRGGKYGVTVFRLSGDVEEVVQHCPSSYGEKEPYINQRIELFDKIGQRVVSTLEDGLLSVDLSPDSLSKLIEEEKQMIAILHPESA